MSRDLTKLGTCIDIKEIWFGIAKFRQCLSELSAHDIIMAGYNSLMFLFVTAFVSRLYVRVWFSISCQSVNILHQR